MTSAKTIFETGSRYVTQRSGWLWFCQMEAESSAEFDTKNINGGKDFLKQAGVRERVVWHQGDALKTMSQAKGLSDLILNDVDRHQFPEAFKIAWPKLRHGGVMVTDNALWSGDMLDHTTKDEDTKGVITFNRLVYALPDSLSTLVPLRDGLLVSVNVG